MTSEWLERAAPAHDPQRYTAADQSLIVKAQPGQTDQVQVGTVLIGVGVFTALSLMWWLEWRVQRRAFARVWGMPAPRFSFRAVLTAFIVCAAGVGASHSSGLDRGVIVAAGVLGLVSVAAYSIRRRHQQ